MLQHFHLESFLAVAEEGSITHAARALHLTQPAVTQHIQALERELGAVLLERTGRGVRLTPAGMVLRDYARRWGALMEECRMVIADQQKGTAGVLLLGAGVTTSIFQLPRWLQAFRRSCPHVDVTVRTGTSREVSALTLDREIDLGLVTSPVQDPALTVEDLFEEEIVLALPRGHELAGHHVSARDLGHVPLILFPRGTGFRRYIDQRLAAAGIAANIKMETDSVEAIKSFVANGLGCSFLPVSAVESELKSGHLETAVVRKLRPLVRKTSVIRRTDRYLSAAALGFLELLRRRYATKPRRS